MHKDNNENGALDQIPQAEPWELAELTSEGLIKRNPMLFDHWIMDHTCSRGLHQIGGFSHTSMEWRFCTNASALAADVAGAAYDWEHAAAVFSHVAIHDYGFTKKNADRHLRKAWAWGRANPSRWMDLTRRWFFVCSLDAFCELPSGELLSREDFQCRFSELSPLLGWPIDSFLFEFELIEEVDRLTRDNNRPAEFYLLGERPVFNHV
jgi:hypothetical protein